MEQEGRHAECPLFWAKRIQFAIAVLCGLIILSGPAIYFARYPYIGPLGSVGDFGLARWLPIVGATIMFLNGPGLISRLMAGIAISSLMAGLHILSNTPDVLPMNQGMGPYILVGFILDPIGVVAALSSIILAVRNSLGGDKVIRINLRDVK